MTMQRQVSLGEAAAKLSEHFARAGEETTAPERELILGAKRMLRLLAAPLVEQMGLVKNGHGMAEEDKEEGEEEEEEGEPVELLDSACGTGVVTQEVQATHSAGRRARSRFVCADASAAMVELVRKRAAAEGWANVEARVADARDTKLPGASFTHAAVALGLHLITRPDAVWMAVFGSMLAFLLRTYWDEDTRARHPLDKVRELVRRHLEDKHGGRGWDVEFEVLTVTAVKPRE
ncbi:hypothetical protein HIM_03010 [Hirsutella minnesotensis 3608]|nr:hypothetical protein HIM_03010 [Hirsutella minnesotensis 3608]